MPSESDIAHSVPTFLKDLAAQIFVCGKSINLLKLCSRSKVNDKMIFKCSVETYSVLSV
jgi:hypothetical protein